MMFFKRGSHFNIYIPRLSVRGLHVLSILTKYFCEYSLLTMKVQTPSDPHNFRSHATIMKT